VVVIGTGSVGKTSLINALLGRSVGETGPTMGTTRSGRSQTHAVQGLEGTLLLTDTPGLGEPGAGGEDRESETVRLAADADLLVFVVDYDLTRAEHRTLLEMSRLGKRIIVVLNKKDRLTEEDRDEILSHLRERLDGFVPPEDVVAIAAGPAPVPVRVRKADGTMETILEPERPDLDALESRVAAVLEREGDALRAGNLLLRAYLRERAERERLARRRHDEAFAIIERHQWIAAGTAFANPVLALGPMAAGAVQLKMLSEMASLYGIPLSTEHVETLGRQMVQTLFKMGIAEAAASLLAGVFKFNPLGFAAGGVVQAVTMAYLTRLTGQSFLEYIERGQDWGEGGMEAALAHQLEETRRMAWFMEFAKAAINRILKR
jgi:small GTP-binding protein